VPAERNPITGRPLRRFAVLDQHIGTARSTDHEMGPGLPAHFYNTPSAAVARLWVGSDLVEIISWKRGNLRPTYQGYVQHNRAAGIWTAHAKEQLIGTAADFRDAELHLLLATSRRPAVSVLTWPRTINAHLPDHMLPACRVCGQGIRGLECERYMLHAEMRRAGTAYGRTVTA
jgi:hypothetical protein